MTGLRGIVGALCLSVCLHAGLALALRGLGFGPPADRASLPPLYVDLVEPIVVVPAPWRPSLSGPAPPGPVIPRARDALRGVGDTPAGAFPSLASPGPPVEPLDRGPSGDSSGVGSPSGPVPSRAPALSPPAPVPPAPSASPAEPTAGVSSPVADEPSPPRSAAVFPGLPVTPFAQRSALAGSVPAPLAPAGSSDVPPARPGDAEERRPGTGAPPGGAGGVEGDVTGAAGASGAATPPRDRPAPGSVEVAALPGERGQPLRPEYEGYVNSVRRRIQERLVYPWLAVRRGLHGVVELEVELDPAGRLIGVAAVADQGPRLLRDAAIQAVRDATPVPFPPGLTPRALRIRLPVVFELK